MSPRNYEAIAALSDRRLEMSDANFKDADI